MSKFSVPVIRIGSIKKHPNADSLSLVEVDGENVIIRTGDFKEGEPAIYVPVDAFVPTSVPGTEFLGERPKDRRIRAKRLRGVYSEGLLLPMSALGGREPELDGVILECAGPLGITKWEDAIPETFGTRPGGPSLPAKKGLLGRFFHWAFKDQLVTTVKDPGCIPHYDIEPLNKYAHILEENEDVVVTEKLHGTNARFGYVDGQFYVGSRNNFWRDMDNRPVLFRERFGEFVRVKVLRRKERDNRKKNVYWKVAHEYDLRDVCILNPGYVFYGEIFGDVQDLKYDAEPGEVFFRVFDIYDTYAEEWLDWDDVEAKCETWGLDTVPVLYRGPYSREDVERFVESKSSIGDNIREGVVVKPYTTRTEPGFGRVILKRVSQGYKLRKGGTECH